MFELPGVHCTPIVKYLQICVTDDTLLNEENMKEQLVVWNMKLGRHLLSFQNKYLYFVLVLHYNQSALFRSKIK